MVFSPMVVVLARRLRSVVHIMIVILTIWNYGPVLQIMLVIKLAQKGLIQVEHRQIIHI